MIVQMEKRSPWKCYLFLSENMKAALIFKYIANSGLLLIKRLAKIPSGNTPVIEINKNLVHFSSDDATGSPILFFIEKSLTEERWTGSLVVTCVVLVESHHYWPADPGTMMQWDCQMKTMTRNLQQKPICVENSITRQGGLTVLNKRSTPQVIWEPNDGITSPVTWNQSLCQKADSSN